MLKNLLKIYQLKTMTTNKPVTRDRILATLAKIDAFCNRLSDADMAVLMVASIHGLSTMAHNAFGMETPQIETDKTRLELNINGVTSPTDGKKKIDRLFSNMDRIHKKHEKVVAVQLAHNISGLQMGEDQIGDGVIQLWEPLDIHLALTDDDLDLLRGDRLKLLQFWIDHITLNNLEIYKDVDGEWMESTLAYIRVMSRGYDWVHFWEHKSYLQTDYSQPVRHSSNPDAIAGYVCKDSSTPQEGFRKYHEIHLVLGDGKNTENPERSMWFCATNGGMPSR